MAIRSYLLLLLLLLFCAAAPTVDGLAPVSRRQALAAATAAATTTALSRLPGGDDDRTTTTTIAEAAVAAAPPQPMVTLAGGLQLPQIGYSLYKTPEEQVANGVRIALAAGVRHFDVATQYGTNTAVGAVLQDYIQRGAASLTTSLDKNNDSIIPLSLAAPVPRTAKRRQQELFVTHKVSNAEQSLSTQELQAAVVQQRNVLLGNSSNDDNIKNFVVLVHSPLTDRGRRLRTYAALQDLQSRHAVGAVGVCHYGVNHLQELVDAGLPAPALIQLELSPFHRHGDVVAWAGDHQNCALSCAAWSRLSSAAGPQDQWAMVGQLASQKGVTKQQVLIRWALQSGYLCVPRSSAQYKVERAAIRENAWPSIRTFSLTDEEMDLLNSLDVQLPVGQLGVTDGWETTDIVNAKWDPTLT